MLIDATKCLVVVLTDVILPEHIYRVGIEIPEGYYLFKFDKAYYKELISYCRNEEECALELHENYAYSRYHKGIEKKNANLGKNILLNRASEDVEME